MSGPLSGGRSKFLISSSSEFFSSFDARRNSPKTFAQGASDLRYFLGTEKEVGNEQ